MKDARIAVIGAGEMGHGIAEVFAIGGYSVSLCDVDRKFLENAVRRIGESLEKLSAKGSLKDKPADVAARISIHTSIKEAVSDSHMIIEAVPEKEDIKAAVLKEVEKFAPSGAIIGSNTSNIRITALARNLADRTRMIGTHFFNPPVVMKLVEVVKGEESSDKVVEEVLSILRDLRKTPVLVHRDTPGFIVNRINAADLLFFGMLQDKGVATPEEIDAFGRAQGLPMGPYELLDFVGIDIVKNSLDYYAAELSPDYGKCRIYNDLYSKNMLGKKTGRGFYDWSSGRPHIDISKATSKVPLIDLFSLEINEAVKLIEEEVATPDEIETAVRLGMNRPFGPISVAKSLSNAEVKESLEKLSSTFGIDVFKPARSIEEGRLRETISGIRGSAKAGIRTENREGDKLRQTAAEGSKVTISRQGKVAVVAIRNPRHNTIDAEVLAGIESAVETLWNDTEITVILIRGEGESFSAGAQLSSFFRTASEFMEFSRRGERTFRKLSEIPKITVAALKGYVLGGGFELSLACDIRLASADAKIGFPEVTLGLIPAWGGSQRLPKLVGMSRALNLILTGERIGADEAKSIGLVTRIVGDADAEGLKFCQEIAGSTAPIAAMLAKRLINKGSEVASDVGLEMESFAAGILFGTEDLKEGISAFMQKRKPDFRGR